MPEVIILAQISQIWTTSTVGKIRRNVNTSCDSLTHPKPSRSCYLVPSLFSAQTDEGGAGDTEYFTPSWMKQHNLIVYIKLCVFS